MLIYSFCPFVLKSRKVPLKKMRAKALGNFSLPLMQRGLANLAIIHSTDKRRPDTSNKN